jgi:hypothetical protein
MLAVLPKIHEQPFSLWSFITLVNQMRKTLGTDSG